MHVGIAHASVVSGDAIGHDILGMHDVLVEGGFSVDLIAEYFESSIPVSCQQMSVEDAIERNDFDLLIYHHSILWEKGEELLRSISARRLLKYHNITPANFFSGYSEFYEMQCRAGREQTRRLVGLFDEGDGFSADSAYNAAELMEAGAKDVSVVPPFTTIANFAQAEPLDPRPPFSVLFVGRLAPNKGHFDLLHVIAAYVATIDQAIKLTLVGGSDDNLVLYRDEVLTWIERLGLEDKVEIKDKVDAATLHRLFREASAFLCMSEHEGFCVPVIEAQLSGLPVVSVGNTALKDTIGPGQLVVEAPRSAADYVYVARLVHAACTNTTLRRNVIMTGQRNVLNRFAPAAVADSFLGALVPILEGLA